MLLNFYGLCIVFDAIVLTSAYRLGFSDPIESEYWIIGRIKSDKIPTTVLSVVGKCFIGYYGSNRSNNEEGLLHNRALLDADLDCEALPD